MKRILMAGLLLGALVAPVAADRADDDLAAVKKAVGTTIETEAQPPAEEAPAKAEKAEKAHAEERHASRHRSHKGEPQWIRVRIAEKSEKHARVVVNLPLDILRALDEDLELDDHHGHHTLGEVLRALDSGEHLVDIDDEDSSVHVWVE